MSAGRDSLFPALRVAYADPPYPGQSAKHYGDHPDFQGEVDHPALIAQLCDEYPDGWALSTHVRGMRQLLTLCPDDTRVGAWVKPFAVIKKNVRVTYAWEPVIWRGGRKAAPGERSGEIKDWISENIVLSRSTDAANTKGTKPLTFCFWVFGLLNLAPGDELVDLFPGSGAVQDAWEAWQRQGTLRLAQPSKSPSKDRPDPLFEETAA